jgi:hypothetical protein
MMLHPKMVDQVGGNQPYSPALEKAISSSFSLSPPFNSHSAIINVSMNGYSGCVLIPSSFNGITSSTFTIARFHGTF